MAQRMRTLSQIGGRHGEPGSGDEWEACTSKPQGDRRSGHHNKGRRAGGPPKSGGRQGRRPTSHRPNEMRMENEDMNELVPGVAGQAVNAGGADRGGGAVVVPDHRARGAVDAGGNVEGLAGWSEVLLIGAAVACLLFALGGVALS